MKDKLFYLLSLLILASMLLAACGAQTVQDPSSESTGSNKPIPNPAAASPAIEESAVESSAGPKVLHVNFGIGDVPTTDPAVGEDTSSIQVVKETFVGLTNIDEATSETQPGMATSWDIVDNDNGTQTVTFHLRNDVPWVRWNGETVETVKTCDGSADRMVTASDFVYGVYRNQLPANASPYAYLLSNVLKGAADFSSGATEDFSTVGIKAIDDSTLEMTFLTQAAYNIQIAGMWVAYAQPKWIIDGDCDGAVEARGEAWIEPGFYHTYGPFTLKSWIHDSSLTLVKNPFWPGSDAIPQPKIDEVNFLMLDEPAAFAEYEAGNLDATLAPLSDLDRIKTDAVLSREYRSAPESCTYYYGFNTKAPVVDDVRVRLALSMAIDRQGLIDNITKGGQEPAQWFGRPGLAGVPTMETHPDLGVKYKPEEAKRLLDEYLTETNQTADQLNLTLMFNTNAGHQKIAEAIQQMWASDLGVNVNLVNQEWAVFLETTESRDTPQIFRKGWCQDYPDANNFIREVFAAGGNQNPAEDGEPYGGINWKNEAFEEIVRQAAVETDPAKRVELYAQAEQILVVEDAAIAPIYWYSRNTVTKPYIVRTFGVGGQEAFEKWDILPD